MANVKKVVIPVAGLGTRGLPFTKEIPKELLPVIDTPAIHFIVEEVLSAGIEQVIFITAKGKSVLEDYFCPSPSLESWLVKRGKTLLADQVKRIGSLCEVISVRQKEPLGLGDAINCARHLIHNERFAVCLGDEIFPQWKENDDSPSTLNRLVSSAESACSSVVGIMEVSREQCSSYGIVDLGGKTASDQPAKVLQAVEKPSPANAPSQYAIVGRYVFEPAIFDCLKEIKPGSGGELQLTDAMNMLCNVGKLQAILATSQRYDLGNHFFYLKAQIDYALTRPELSQQVQSYLRTI